MAKLCRLSTVAPLLLRRCIGVLPKRGYGSAAAVQVDYDYYDSEEEEDEGDVYRKLAMAEAEGCVSGRGVHWVVIGEPGAKKHVYAERLSEVLQVPHISMGTLVRQELSPHSYLYKQIANAVNQGKLVPEDIIFGLLSKRLEEGYIRGENGFILDGIPRTRIQAEILDQIADIDLVVNFKCTEDCFVRNHLKSGSCSHHREFHGGANPGSYLKLPAQDGQLNSTADTRLAWKEKLRIYAEQSKPLEDYYRKQRKLLDFEVAGAPGETWQGLLAALHLQHVNAVNSSSQKLTA